MRASQIVLLLLLSLLWGTAYLFMRSSVPAFGAAPMIFLRMALASLLVLLPLTIARTGLAPLRRHWRELLVFGVAFTALPFLGLGYAALAIPAGLMAILQSSAPLFAAIVGHLWLKDRVSRSRAAGLLIGFAGVGVLVWDRVGVTEAAGLAVLATLAVTALWGVSSNYARARLSHIDPIVVATGSLTVAAFVLAPLAWVTWPDVPPGPKPWAEVVFLGIASSGFGFLIYFSLLRQVGAVRTVSVTFLNPAVAMASAAVYLGEPVTLRMVAGCAVILVGTALTLGLLPTAALAKRLRPGG